MRIVSSKKFVATQNTSMSGGPIVGEIFLMLAQSSPSGCVKCVLPVQQRPAGKQGQQCFNTFRETGGTNKSQVARAEEHFDENPAHLPESECSSCKKPECCVEACYRQFPKHVQNVRGTCSPR